MAVKHFRSALNGFNRQDVVQYIEYLNNQHNAKVEQLNNQLRNAKFPAESELQAKLDAALARIAQLEEIIQSALCEAQIESLVIAKGYRDCVAYMSDDGISIAVAAPEGGLQQADVAVIADVVMTQTDYTMSQIRVVEVL